VTYVSEKTVPTLILHGLADTTVNHDQASELAAKLKEAGVEHQLILIPGIGHTFDLQTWNRKPLPQDLRPVAMEFFDKHLKPSSTTKAAASIEWDQKTLRYLCPGGYPRMIRLNDGAALLSAEEHGRAIVRRSDDGGKTWSEPVEAARSDHGAATNPQPLQLQAGPVLLFYNERPTDHKSPYEIRLTTSRDGGRSWERHARPIYTADTQWNNGCWEPAAVQHPSGEIALFFANESPYRESDEQEISVTRSADDGATWSEAKAFSFRKGGRDGMPVPLMLKSGELVVAIEDTGGRPSHVLQPSILHVDHADPSVIGGQDPRRTVPIGGLDEQMYAGAPFIAQLSTGETLLSCQLGNWRARPSPKLALFLGDSSALNFAQGAPPFEQDSAHWNALFVDERDTIVALSGTEFDRKSGVWAIDGRLARASGDSAR
jgi:hypothetical protein